MINSLYARLLPVAAIALWIGAIGCESDSTVSTARDPDEDQALALSVMGARGDTLGAAVENEIVVDTALPPDLRPSTPAPQSAVAAAPSFSPAVVRAASAPKVATIQSEPHTVVETVSKPAPQPVRTRPRTDTDVETVSRTGFISKGSTLSVAAIRAVCNDAASIGNTFRAVITSPVRGTNGTVIPSGAQAVAEVASVDKWGAGIGVRVKSLRFNGRSYAVTSHVGYVLPAGGDSGACIPRRARLDVETKAPIRIASIQN